MAVATPLSLNNIKNEFGPGVLLREVIDGPANITKYPPPSANSVKFYVWGAGGGGGDVDAGGGGGGGFLIKTLSVNTSSNLLLSVSSGGFGGTGGYGGADTSVTGYNIPGIFGFPTYISYSGKGRADGTGQGGGTNGNGDYNETGSAGTSTAGGAAAGKLYGGGLGDGLSPGSGGAPSAESGVSGQDGANGRVIIEWTSYALTGYKRGNGAVANHAANQNIPTSNTNLSISDFSGTESNFSATITVGNDGLGLDVGSYGYYQSSYGSVNRTQIGLSKSSLDTTNLKAIFEYGSPFYDGFGNFLGYIFVVTFTVPGNKTRSSLGYYFLNGINDGTSFLTRASSLYPDGLYDVANDVTSFQWIVGFARIFPTSGTFTLNVTMV